MPRPGPRPYECVRRSWHSDRHQPIRGSIIQQIFRVVHENHSTGTTKNREWQEKLPLVVLKSEEIMYSKANSEAEYIDPDTLWDRVNDAINTIIRKDETMETGEFLPPCVEVRTSRSQRNSNTRSYLGPRNQIPGATSPKTVETAISARNISLPNRERPNAVNQTHNFSESNRNSRQNYQISAPGPSFYRPPIDNFPKHPSSSVYPLYYGLHLQPQNPRAVFHNTHQNSNAIIVGKPVFQTAHERLPPPLTNFHETSFKKTVDEEPPPSPVECDLSLRLGPVSSSGNPSGSSFNPENREFSFFPLNSEGEQVENLVADVRKRKAVSVKNDGGQGLSPFEHDFNQKRRGF